MNNKEAELNRILDNVVKCCATEVNNSGTMSITREDVLGTSRCENVCMTRCIFASQVHLAGYSYDTIAMFLNRTVPAVRNMITSNESYLKTSRAYRIAYAESLLMNKELE